jgi:hypothetical protein
MAMPQRGNGDTTRKINVLFTLLIPRGYLFLSPE